VLDLFRLTMTHKRYPDDSTILIKNAKKLVKKLLQSHFFGACVLLQKLFVYNFQNAKDLSEKQT
jgi:hypothetical protein